MRQVSNMLKIYLFSIVIWAIMIYGTIWLFEDKIKENGWLEVKKQQKSPFLTLFLIVAIPIVRVLMFICAIGMIATTKEKFEKWQEELNDESN
jgi:hypothetical protein